MTNRRRPGADETLDVGQPPPNPRLGVAAGLAAHGLWGVMPLYFAALRAVPPTEILGQRVVWCGLILAAVLTVLGRWPDFFRACRSGATVRTFLITALLLSFNWLVYIYGVATGQTVETSLGYFINPLLNVALGYVFFRERLRPLQLAAIGLALIGVANLILAAGEFPWIALALAASFALYGLLRKTAPADAVVGLSIETLLLLPPACAYVTYLWATGQLHLGTVDGTTDALLLASGFITAVPLLFFGVAARNLSLSTLGFLQYVAPSAQFVLAITVLGEPMAGDRWISFGCIWIALATYSLDTWRGLRRSRRNAVTLVARPEPVASRTG